MRYSRADKARSRRRILDAASSRLRRLGIAGVTIAPLMRSANLTHGAFYSHFRSRDDLILEGLKRALEDGENSLICTRHAKGCGTIASLLHLYLSNSHRDDVSGGCAVASLANDVARYNRRSRAVMADHLSRYIERIRELLGDNPDDKLAVFVLSAIAGSMILSRATRDHEISDKLLLSTRDLLIKLCSTH